MKNLIIGIIIGIVLILTVKTVEANGVIWSADVDNTWNNNSGKVTVIKIQDGNSINCYLAQSPEAGGQGWWGNNVAISCVKR